jgi:hypothetical protein
VVDRYSDLLRFVEENIANGSYVRPKPYRPGGWTGDFTPPPALQISPDAYYSLKWLYDEQAKRPEATSGETQKPEPRPLGARLRQLLLRNKTQNNDRSSRKPPRMLLEEIVSKKWLEVKVPDTRPVKTMLLPEERKLLYFLASEHWEDRGSVIDAGCFVGGSTTALALGVRDRQQRTGVPPQRKIHSYDLFQAEEWTIGNLLPATFTPGQSFRPIFDENIRDIAELVEVHHGDITSRPWAGGPVEILFIDCAKTRQVCDFVTHQFFNALMPGRSIVIQQDYIWESWNAWIHITMEYYSDYFRILTFTDPNSVAFLYERKIPKPPPNLVGSMDAATKLELMRRARARFEPPHRDYLERSHRLYVTGPAWANGVDPEGHARAAAEYELTTGEDPTIMK